MAQKISGLISELISEVGGKYPDVPLADGVELETLTEGDEKPFFITLPIGAVTVSRNDRVYRRDAVEAIKQAVNDRKIGGILGHLKDDARPYEFNIPVIHWVGAVFEGDTLWAKGYIPKTQPELREYMRIAMRTKSEVGTSIYGTAEIEDDGRVTNLWVETVDIAHPDRVGVTRAAEVPAVTSETVQPVQEGQEFRFRIRRGIYNKITDRPDWDEIVGRIADGCKMTIGQVWDLMDTTDPIPDEFLKVFSSVLNIPLDELRQLAAINPDPNVESNSSEEVSNGESQMANDPTQKPVGEAAPDTAAQIVEMERKHTEAIRDIQLKLTNAENAIRDFTKMKSLLGIAETEDAIIRTMAINGELANLRKENGDLLEATIKAEVAAKVAVESQRGMIEALVKEQKPARRVDVTTALESVMTRPEVKAFLITGVAETQGPPANRPTTPSPSPADDAARQIIPGVY